MEFSENIFCMVNTSSTITRSNDLPICQVTVNFCITHKYFLIIQVFTLFYIDDHRLTLA